MTLENPQEETRGNRLGKERHEEIKVEINGVMETFKNKAELIKWLQEERSNYD